MCIAYLAIGAHPDWPLFIAANRDEFHARPTTVAGPWPTHPELLAGIDQMAGGTWLGVTRQGLPGKAGATTASTLSWAIWSKAAMRATGTATARPSCSNRAGMCSPIIY